MSDVDPAARRRTALRGLVVALVVAALGAAAGALWEALWTPPTGVAFQHRFVLDGEGLSADFQGTALYVLIGVAVGLASAMVIALAGVVDEVVTVVALLVGSLLGAFLMWRVGTLLGPPDVTPLARRAADLQPLVGDLHVRGLAAFAALPAGAMAGAAAVYLLDRRHHRA